VKATPAKSRFWYEAVSNCSIAGRDEDEETGQRKIVVKTAGEAPAPHRLREGLAW